MRWTPLTAILGVLAAAPALAQTDRTTTPTGSVSVTGATLFNLQATQAAGGICNGGTPSITAVMTAANSFTPVVTFGADTSVTTFAFWTTDTDCYGNIPDDDDSVYLGDDSVDFTITPTRLDFPDDFGVTGFNASTFLTEIGNPCETGGSVQTQRLLCLVADLNAADTDKFTADAPLTTSPGTGSWNGDWVGWITFRFDNVPPPEPTITVTDLDSALQVDVSVPGNVSDLGSYSVRVREAQNDGVTDCTQWAVDDLVVVVNNATQTGTSFTFPVSGLTNGVEYEICVGVQDTAKNNGPFSAIASGTPVDECDFVECFPGGAPSGYCGAAGAGGLWGGTLLALIWRGRRRRGSPR